MKKSVTYQQAGVDIEKAEKSLASVKQLISRTHNSRVLKDIGSFGGFYEFPQADYTQPVLISSTDGVGTKLKVAMMMNKHDTIGADLVNHCINDIAVCGAKPLFFLDYFGCGKLEEEVFQQIISGFSNACQAAELPLIGGETAEMPDLYRPGEYDLAGTIVGVVERHQIIDGSTVREGDILIGVASNGLHTNGYSLARKIFFPKYRVDDYLPEIGTRLGDELLKIHLNYYPIIRELSENFPLKGIAHITGGGLFKNTIRVVPEGLLPEFDWYSWPVLPFFNLIKKLGNVPENDMRQTFNLGIGLVLIVDKKQASEVMSYAEKFTPKFYEIGKIIKSLNKGKS